MSLLSGGAMMRSAELCFLVLVNCNQVGAQSIDRR
jgi:hypothetical protein